MPRTNIALSIVMEQIPSGYDWEVSDTVGNYDIGSSPDVVSMVKGIQDSVAEIVNKALTP